MSVRAFVVCLNSAEHIGNDVYRGEVSMQLMDTSNSKGVVQFEATWGADWRMIVKNAVAAWCLEHLGETVDAVIFPDFSTM